MTRFVVLSPLLVLVACGVGTEPLPSAPDAATAAGLDAEPAFQDADVQEDSGQDAAVQEDSGQWDSGQGDSGQGDSGQGDSGVAGDWSDVDQLIAAAFAGQQLDGMGVAIYDAADQPVFQRIYGDFAFDRRVAVASSSKLISGTVLLELVDRGLLSLSSTTGALLDWTGPNKDITLRHLLSFTSGLERDAMCTGSRMITLAECVDRIRDLPIVALPGERYDYGGTHLHVAARMAEVVTGQTWNTLFREMLADPLELDPGVRYYTAPRQSGGTTNPLIGGGLRASMDEYAQLMAVVFHRGRYRSLEIASDSLYEEQRIEPYPNVLIGQSPMAGVGLPYRYGLSAWLECSTPAAGCDVISSPGAFGFTPWLDRAGGYYAIIGMEAGLGNGGVVAFSVSLAQSLKPLILEHLAN
jgi:CubicO group peptidase (beta-lactamase class C family)